jgi:tripartite-type tricarboxylate transporter receptor subunit TctC
MKKLLALLVLSISLMAHAWEPTKPINVYVGIAPGSGNELAFRKLAEIVQKTSDPKFNYIMQNIPGVDGVISANKFLDAAADGYNIAIPSHMSMYVTNDIWEKNVKKFKYNDFIDVLTMGKSPLVLVAHTSSAVNTPQDFVKLINTTKNPVNVAVGGGAHRTAYEFIMHRAQGNKSMVQPIRFNGPLPAVTSVAQFQPGNAGTEFGIMPITVARPLVEAGKVKAIGFTGTRKMPQYPDVPLLNTVAPGINVYAAWSIQLPRGTDAEVIEWYQRTFAEAIRSEEYREWRRQNVVFYEESELTTQGLRKHIEELRSTFLPVLNNIDTNKE